MKRRPSVLEVRCFAFALAFSVGLLLQLFLPVWLGR